LASMMQVPAPVKVTTPVEGEIVHTVDEDEGILRLTVSVEVLEAARV